MFAAQPGPDTLETQSKRPDIRKTRLPWLDHAPPSLRNLADVHVPGAYEDDQMLQVPKNGRSSSTNLKTSVTQFSRVAEDTSSERIELLSLQPLPLRSDARKVSITPAPTTIMPELPTSQASVTSTVISEPGNPLVSLMNEARKRQCSESSLASRAMPRDQRRRSCSESPSGHDTSPGVATTLRRQSGRLFVPRETAFNNGIDVNSAGERFRSSVGGLELLMQETISLARDAADRNHVDDVSAILNQATETLMEASLVQRRYESILPVSGSDLRSSFSSPLCSSKSSGSRTVSCGSSDDDSVLSPGVSIMPSPLKLRHKGSPRSKRGASHGIVSAAIQAPLAPSTTNFWTRKPAASNGPRSVWDEAEPGEPVAEPSPAQLSTAQRQLSVLRPGPGETALFDFAYPRPLDVSRSITPYEGNRTIRRRSDTPALRSVEIAGPAYEHGEGRGLQTVTINVTEPISPGHNPHSPDCQPRLTKRQKSRLDNWGKDKYDEKDYMTADTLKGRSHLTLRDDQKFSLHHNYKRQPIARNWTDWRKRFTATVVCLNTALIGIIIGIYAGEVPAIQYALVDQRHYVILGNVVLFIGMAISSFLFWPLPLLHGRKPYTLVALALALALQFPQAIIVSARRNPADWQFRFGLLFSRAVMGLILGFAHINFKTTLLDLFGASLQSHKPHGEVVLTDDVRRHGGGMGLWLGLWSWCFIGSIALGFFLGATIINGLPVAWGYYIGVILIAAALLLNVVAPETRRSPHRRTMAEVELPNMSISRRVVRGEITLHVKGDGPKWWWEEVFAGIYLSFRMIWQVGFSIMALYLAWIYAEVVLVIVLLGNLLSAGYRFRSTYVGLGVLSVSIGAALAIPLSKANLFSDARVKGLRTDSMTFETEFTWTSHMVRRFVFTIMLPLCGVAYTLASGGPNTNYMVPIIFAGAIGFFSNLAISECHGLIMETYDTSDLQPGTNSRHRLASLPPGTTRKRTTYSSYPRVSAGFLVSQSLGFLLAAGATGIGGLLTRRVGAQRATAITAGILFGLTLLLTMVLLRFKKMQVIPNELFGHLSSNASPEQERRQSATSVASDRSWRAVVIGNPSGKMRRMNMLELGSLSRWTEIRRLNRLLTRQSTQALNPGWR